MFIWACELFNIGQNGCCVLYCFPALSLLWMPEWGRFGNYIKQFFYYFSVIYSKYTQVNWTLVFRYSGVGVGFRCVTFPNWAVSNSGIWTHDARRNHIHSSHTSMNIAANCNIFELLCMFPMEDLHWLHWNRMHATWQWNVPQMNIPIASNWNLFQKREKG